MFSNLFRRFALGLIGLYIILIGAQPATAQPAAPRAGAPDCATGISRYESWSRDLPCVQPDSEKLDFSRIQEHPVRSDIPRELNDVSIYTDLVFSSFRDGNWEIYYEDDPYPSRSLLYSHRVTNDPSADLRPALRPGSPEIVFSSNRSGNYELYFVKWDGSGLRALTNHPGYDSQPAWSPDGTRLAFASDRDGNLEIYTMLPDGSELKRHTFDAADDFHPSWSPDGSTLVWVRAVSDQDGVVYRMPFGGTTPEAYSFVLRYAQHPIMASRFVALDFDGNGDGWIDLGWILSDGTEMRVTVTSPGMEDFFAGSWIIPYNELILANRVSYILYDGEYYIDRACLAEHVLYNPYVFCWYDSYFDFYPNSAKNDILAPTTWITPLPRYQHAGAIDLNINGFDNGASGLYAINLQKRKSLDGDWTDLGSALYPNALPFSVSETLNAGETVYYRSRGQDKAENIEEWPAGDGDTFTQVYTWELNGQVQDNRGYPRRYVSISSEPVFDDQEDTQLDGKFHRYVPTEPVTITISQPGYGSLPVTYLSSSVDMGYLWALPPAQDQLTNGNFEYGLDNWSIGGEYLPVALAGAHTGLAGSQLGPSLGGLGESISGDTSGYEPCIVADSSGKLHVIWSGSEGGYVGSVYYSSKPNGGDWSQPLMINPNQLSTSTQLDLAVDPDDGLHAVWLDYSYQAMRVMYASKPDGGSWTAPVDLSGERYVGSPVEYANPEILVDSTGGYHLMFADQDGIWYINRPSGGSWSAPFRLNWFSEHSMALDLLNNLHVVYQDTQLTHRIRSADGVWGDATMIGVDMGYRLSTATDSVGRLHMIYYYDQVLYHTYRQSSGGWIYPEPISDFEYIYSTALAVSGENVHVAWDSQQGLAYRRQFGSGVWSPTIYTPATFYSLDLFVQGDQVHAVFGDNQLAKAVYNTWSMPQQGASRLAQAVNIPSDMHEPTLSFLFKLEQEGAYTFTVTVSDTLVHSHSFATAGWEHVWVDMHPWAGKTVTVTFEAQNDLLENVLIARVDDVSLGPWTTPLVTAPLPQQIDANVTTAITITGENFMPTPQVLLNGQSSGSVTWLDENTLHVDFPVGLPPGQYEITVVNPGGAFDVWAGKLNVGKQVYLPAILR